MASRRLRRYWTPYRKNQLLIGMLIVLASGVVALSAVVIAGVIDDSSGQSFLGTRWR